MAERIHMTGAEYRQLPETTQKMELLDSEVITYGAGGMSPAAKDRHDEIISVLLVYLSKFFSPRHLRSSRTDVHFDEANVVQPDVLWFSPETKQCVRGEDGYLHGAPDFIIEVLSPSTAKRDKDDKYELYEKYGVREYWIVDYERAFIEVYMLKDSRFARFGVFGLDESFVSPILGGHVVAVDELLGE